ncbi:hypothetical protein A0H81_01338 [Grifola frondosa]|uniref:Protein kinase domain-containing protein n=1 Tax=Grifola frondosa TaxID=5627 RepID=A0A1C7MPZ4_GRIFR|nr:hypothetical protein A0H81_01338 [Grifola frondosa]
MGATKTSLTEYLPDLPNGRHCSEAPNSAFEAQRFWMAYSPWLAAHGYTLFDMVTGNGYMIPYWVPPLVAVSAPVPYAFYHRDENVPVTPWLMGAVETRFAFAQDAQGRNIAIKVIESDSEEEKIYQHLLHCSELFDPDTFASVLPPICILRSTYRFSFVLMPMWGDRPFIKSMKTVRQVMDFMTDMLRGLSFLHDQRIAHRDIAHTNLISTISQFPSGQPIESYRSPSTEAFIGWDCFHPWDVYQGEFDYNPFAFDVACLGKLFMLRFAEYDCVAAEMQVFEFRIRSPDVLHKGLNPAYKVAMSKSVANRHIAINPDMARAIALDALWRAQSAGPKYAILTADWGADQGFKAGTLVIIENQATVSRSPGDARGIHIEPRPDEYTYKIKKYKIRHSFHSFMSPAFGKDVIPSRNLSFTNPLADLAAQPITWSDTEMGSAVYVLHNIEWTERGRLIKIPRGTPCTIEKLASRVGSQQGVRNTYQCRFWMQHNILDFDTSNSHTFWMYLRPLAHGEQPTIPKVHPPSLARRFPGPGEEFNPSR